MGRQIRILMLPDDMLALERDLQKFEIRIVPGDLKEPRLDFFSDFQLRKPGKENLRVYLTRQEDLQSVVIRPSGNGRMWTIDDLRSPVIQFDRCYFDGKIIRKGRFFYDLSWFGSNGKIVSKSEGFQKWAQQMFAFCRKKLVRNAELDAYVGASAMNWLNRGGVVMP